MYAYFEIYEHNFAIKFSVESKLSVLEPRCAMKLLKINRFTVSTILEQIKNPIINIKKM